MKRSFRNLLITCVVGFVGAIIFGFPAHALTINQQVETCTIERSRLDWMENSTPAYNTVKTCTLPQFNLAKGKITQVAIEVSAQTDTVQHVENKDVTPHTLVSSVMVDATLKNPNGLSLLQLNVPAAQKSFNATAFDGTLDYAGTSGITYDPQYAQNSEIITLTNPNDYAFLIGIGNVSFPMTAIANWTCSGSGNADCGVDTFAQAQVKVTYSYEEPAPDLIVNSCNGTGDHTNATYTIIGANQGTRASTEPVTTTISLPGCMIYTKTLSNSWTCNNAGAIVTCIYSGNVPVGSFLPELKIETDTKNCSGLISLGSSVTIGVPDESNPSNNSASCNTGGVDLAQVLGQQSTPTPTPVVSVTLTDVCENTVSGHVYEDTNQNGQQDNNEVDVPGAKVTVTLPDGKKIETTTDSNGNYSVCCPPGMVTVEVNGVKQVISVADTGNTKVPSTGLVKESQTGNVLASTGITVGIIVFAGILLVLLIVLFRRRYLSTLPPQ